MGYIDNEDLHADASYCVQLIGKSHEARILTEPAYDPAGSRLRS